MSQNDQIYLRPYEEALRKHGTEFPSLLWASRHTQHLRFEALCRVCNFTDQNVCDAGCGQADLLDYLIERKMPPAHYVGLEAMQEHAAIAQAKRRPNCVIVKADFLREPQRLLVGADVIVFCGSLNTLSEWEFYRAVSDACSAAASMVVFNFLCSPALAGASWLTWHDVQKVKNFAQRLSGRSATVVNDYLDGDCTMGIRKA